MSWTRNFLVAVVVLLLVACSDSSPDAPAGESLAEQLPTREGINVLVISFDALRADALGFHGYHRPTSPRLDDFAQRSVVFEHAYSAAPVTPTSFAAAFSGRLPFRNFHQWKLLEGETIAKAFARAGYRTFGLMNNVQLVAERHFDQGFETYDAGSWTDEQVLERGLKQLEEVQGQRFFGWIHFISPHTPYDYRELAAQFYDPDYQGRYEKTSGGSFDVQNEAELKRVRDLYDGEVYFADLLFGQVLDHLERLGLADNTVIVVTSDHGEEFLDHGQLQHNAQYEEVIQIPMLIHHPDRPEGHRTNAPYLNTDLLPTLTAIAGIPHEPVTDGIDLTRPWPQERARLSTGMTHGKIRQMSMTQLRDKLIVSCKPEYREELYNLGPDPLEQTDSILDAPELAGTLYERMQAIALVEPCRAIEMAVAGVSPETGLSEEQIEQLRSLGYIQ